MRSTASRWCVQSLSAFQSSGPMELLTEDAGERKRPESGSAAISALKIRVFHLVDCGIRLEYQHFSRQVAPANETVNRLPCTAMNAATNPSTEPVLSGASSTRHEVPKQ